MTPAQRRVLEAILAGCASSPSGEFRVSSARLAQAADVDETHLRRELRPELARLGLITFSSTNGRTGATYRVAANPGVNPRVGTPGLSCTVRSSATEERKRETLDSQEFLSLFPGRRDDEGGGREANPGVSTRGSTPGLDERAVLALEAIAHALGGIVHRDLKPANASSSGETRPPRAPWEDPALLAAARAILEPELQDGETIERKLADFRACPWELAKRAVSRVELRRARGAKCAPASAVLWAAVAGKGRPEEGEDLCRRNVARLVAEEAEKRARRSAPKPLKTASTSVAREERERAEAERAAKRRARLAVLNDLEGEARTEIERIARERKPRAGPGEFASEILSVVGERYASRVRDVMKRDGVEW